MPEMLRLFFALPIPPTLGRHILDWRQQLDCSGSWVHEQDLHLTLAFLGSHPSACLDGLQHLARQLRTPPAFQLRLDQLGLWQGGLLHLSPSQPPEPLLQLQQNLSTGLALLGLPLEQRTYRPHVTLARHAQRPSRAPVFEFAWQVDQFALFSSKSVTIAPRYQQIDTWKLS